jgi:signal transduction histidine kinase
MDMLVARDTVRDGPVPAFLAPRPSTNSTNVAEDRDRISRDLHGSVIQRLFAAGLSLNGALQLVQANPEVTQRIEQAIAELDHVVRDVHNTVFELHTYAASRSTETPVVVLEPGTA